MPKKSNPQYVFRGSSIGWPGNPESQQRPITPTSTHPVKALLFALCCIDYGAPAVIYIAKTNNLSHIETTENFLVEIEDEVAYEVAPLDFIKICEGYISVNDAINTLLRLSITPPKLFNKTQLDMALRDTQPISDKLIEQIYNDTKPFLRQKP